MNGIFQLTVRCVNDSSPVNTYEIDWDILENDGSYTAGCSVGMQQLGPAMAQTKWVTGAI
jgi:hypothetical protein